MYEYMEYPGVLLDEKQLEKTIDCYEGNIPVILTVPHDGRLIYADGIPLPHNPLEKKADLYASIVAHHIQSYLFLHYEIVPWLIIEKIHREYRTEQIINAFNQRVLNTVHTLEAEENRPILILDIHGFSANVDFDVILGTGHRKTIGNGNEDILLADFMRKKEYRIYLPTTEYDDKELYPAESADTLVQLVKQSFLDESIRAMQIEIASEYRDPNNSQNLVKISHDIAEYIMSLSMVQ